MASRSDLPDSASGGTVSSAYDFRTTHWSVVLSAGAAASPDAPKALNELCRTYWYPLYAFVRRKGHSPEDSQDLVQGYFEQLLARQDLLAVHPCKGRFRTFLLTTLSHYLANQWDKERAAKRGGKFTFVALDAVNPEDRYRYEPTVEVTPEMLFEAAWAARTLDAALAMLRQECEAEGRVERFDQLKGFLMGERSDSTYTEIAQRLGTTEQGVKSAVHRLRSRFRELFRDEVARTVAAESEIDDEMRHMIQVMTR